MYEWVLGGEENLERNEKKFKHQSPPKVLGQVELVLENVTETEEHLDMRPLEVNDSKMHLMRKRTMRTQIMDKWKTMMRKITTMYVIILKLIWIMS